MYDFVVYPRNGDLTENHHVAMSSVPLRTLYRLITGELRYIRVRALWGLPAHTSSVANRGHGFPSRVP